MARLRSFSDGAVQDQICASAPTNNPRCIPRSKILKRLALTPSSLNDFLTSTADFGPRKTNAHLP
eukprot:6474332-Pyramimonas_sp.AAC.1